MSAVENEKKNENTVAFDSFEYDSPKEEKHQKVIKRNYNMTRIEANHGAVQPIKDKISSSSCDETTTTTKPIEDVFRENIGKLGATGRKALAEYVERIVNLPYSNILAVLIDPAECLL